MNKKILYLIIGISLVTFLIFYNLDRPGSFRKTDSVFGVLELGEGDLNIDFLANNNSSKVDSGLFLKPDEIRPFIDFDRELYDEALNLNKNILLYFYSGWGSTCVTEFPKAMKALDSFTGQSIVAFRINFDDANTDDEERFIAERLGVRHQYTKVFIRDGKVVLKDGNPWMSEDFVKNFALYFE